MAKAANGTLNTAEMAFLVEKFDPAELYRYEQARQLSITLLKQWLVKYKFRNWKLTKTRHIPVTKKMREDRAEQIAHKLNSTEVWHTHSRGISMHVLRRDLKLEIDDFGSDPNLDKTLKTYYRLLTDYMMRRNTMRFSTASKDMFQ